MVTPVTDEKMDDRYSTITAESLQTVTHTNTNTGRGLLDNM